MAIRYVLQMQFSYKCIQPLLDALILLLPQLRRLLRLSISCISLGGQLSNVVAALDGINLQYLTLNECRLTPVDIQSLALSTSMHRLESLQLRRNRIDAAFTHLCTFLRSSVSNYLQCIDLQETLIGM